MNVKCLFTVTVLLNVHYLPPDSLQLRRHISLSKVVV